MTSVFPGDVVHVLTSEDQQAASSSLPTGVKLGAGLAQATYASSHSAAQAGIEASSAPSPGTIQSTLVATVPGPLGAVTQKKRGPQGTRRYLAARWVEGESNRVSAFPSGKSPEAFDAHVTQSRNYSIRLRWPYSGHLTSLSNVSSVIYLACIYHRMLEYLWQG